jgi:hypothetical protein
MHRLLALVGAIAIASAGCGKSEEEQQAEQAKQTAQAGAEQAAKGLEQLAAGDAKPVPPVSFRELQTVLPALEGWEMGKPTGEMMTMPVSFSQTTVEYTKDDAAIELKIVDTGQNQLLLTPYAMFLTAGYERETEDGYEKSVSVAGQPGWERWNSQGKNGELNAVVGKRFLVTLEGREIADTKVLHEAAAKIDMAKLAAMK